jgi:hypothetical protein
MDERIETTIASAADGQEMEFRAENQRQDDAGPKDGHA